MTIEATTRQLPVRLGLVAVFALAAALRLWGLTQNGFGNEYYTAGGFHGLDPIMTPEKLGALVETRQVPFVMIGDAALISRRLGADQAARPIADWVQEKGQLIDPALWRAGVLGGRRSGMRLYDLRPGPLAAASP
jgi:hypothetical protein